MQSGEESGHKYGNLSWGTFLSSHAWVVLAFCAGGRVLLEDVGAFVSGSVHPWLHNVLQNFLVDLGSDPQAFVEEERGQDVPFLGDDPTAHESGGKLGALYDGDLFDDHADPSVVLLVAFLVLVEDFIRKEPEHSCGLVLEPIEQGRCLDLSRFLVSLCHEHAVRLAVVGVAKFLLDRPAERRLVSVHVSAYLGVSQASITVDGLFGGSEELFGPERRRSEGVGFAIGGKLLLIPTPLRLPPSVHDNGPLDPKPKNHL